MPGTKGLLTVTRVGGAVPSPDGSEVCYIADHDGTFGMWRLPLDGAEAPRRFGDLSEVELCVWRPDGAAILAVVNPGGTEDYQLIELAADGRDVTWRTDEEGVRHEIAPSYWPAFQPYSPDSSLLAFCSNGRDREVFDVHVRDLRTGQIRTVLTGDDRYFPICWSPDGRHLLVHRLHQNTEHALFLCDVASASSSASHRRVTPEGMAKWMPAGWAANGRDLWVVTDHGVDRLRVARLAPDGSLTELPLDDAGAGTDEVDVAAAVGDRLAVAVNRDGWSRLLVTDATGRRPRALTSVPDGVVASQVGLGGRTIRWLPDGRLLLQHSSPTAPDELWLVDPNADTARRITSFGPDLPNDLVNPETVRFGGVPALVYRPPGASAQRPVPVVVDLHGGPEDQHRPEWGWLHPVYDELLRAGIGVLAPNPRGSSGYGKAWQRAVYRDWLGCDFEDVTTAVDGLRELDWVDGSRLAVVGASYGGLFTLACLTRMPGVWRTGIDGFGPSDLVGDAQLVPPYWRRRVKEWIGDVDDPADLARMHARSPLAAAEHIDVPLLVIQGTNDPRVDREHSDALVDRLRELGKPVTYRLIRGEGHGFAARDTNDTVLAAIADWLLIHLR